MILVYLRPTDRLELGRVAQPIQAAAEGRRRGPGPWSAEHAAAASHAPAMRAAAARGLCAHAHRLLQQREMLHTSRTQCQASSAKQPHTFQPCTGRRCNRLPGLETNTTAQHPSRPQQTFGGAPLLDQYADPAEEKRSRKIELTQRWLIRKSTVAGSRHPSP